MKDMLNQLWGEGVKSREYFRKILGGGAGASLFLRLVIIQCL